MKGFVQDVEDLAVKNDEFRRVLYTAKHCQLVVMALKPKEEIGAEVHTLDQFFRVEEGTGEAVLDGVRTAIRAGFAVVVPAGAKHIPQGEQHLEIHKSIKYVAAALLGLKSAIRSCFRTVRSETSRLKRRRRSDRDAEVGDLAHIEIDRPERLQ